MKFILFAALFLFFNWSFAQMTFDSNFDNGRLDSVMQDGNLYTLSPKSYLHFRITGTLNQLPLFRVFQGNDYIFRNGHRMVYRNEGESDWAYFENGYVSGNYYYFNNTMPFESDTAYIAYWFPYTFGQMQSYFTQISNHPSVQSASIAGYSYLNRPIYYFSITDTSVPLNSKKHVVVVARQHSEESLGSHIIKGMSNYLLYSNDSTAAYLTQKTIVHFYQMANSDGVYLGQGYGGPVYLNLNRYWLQGTPSGGNPSDCIEADVLRQSIWDNTGGQAEYGFDLHSHPGHIGQYYWWGLLSGPTPEKVEAAQLLVDRIYHHDSIDHGGNAIVAPQIAQDVWSTPGPYADYWLCETLNAVSFTLEPGSVPPQTLQRIQDVGISICKGLNDVIMNPITNLAQNTHLTLSETFRLYPNFPNPFNSSTTIRYHLSELSSVVLKIYSLHGQEIKTLVNGIQEVGEKYILWHGKNSNNQKVSTGIYVYCLEVNGRTKSKKMLYLR